MRETEQSRPPYGSEEVKYLVEGGNLWPLEAGDRGSHMLSAESHSNQGEDTNYPEVTADLGRRRNNGGDTRTQKVSPSRRLHWHPSYNKTLKKKASPRSSSQEQSSDESGDIRYKRKKDRKAVRDLPEKSDPAVAAKIKASRERQRRERLNDSFVDLSMALDPERSLKAEKTAIIADTIKVLGQMRNENGQLQSEKKQLEEHVANVEREKRELLFEHDLLKRELNTARLHNFPTQSHGYIGHESPHSNQQVALGVPVLSGVPSMTTSMPEPAGGLSKLMKEHEGVNHGLLPHTSQSQDHDLLQRSALLPFDHRHFHQTDEDPIVKGHGAMMPSPPDFFDMDLSMTDALADLSKGSAELGLLSATSARWLSAGEGIMQHEEASRA